jgi:hypothetical protein
MDLSELMKRLEECDKSDYDNKLWGDLIKWILSELEKKEDKTKTTDSKDEE